MAARVNIGTRVTPATLERLDRIAEAIAEQTPGLEATRSDAARAAIEVGLEPLEKRLGLVLLASAPKGAAPARKPKK